MMKRFKNILCVVADGQTCRRTLERAVTLAENNQAQLTVVETIPQATAGFGLPDGGPVSVYLQADMMAKRKATLEFFTAPYRKRLDIRHDVLMGTGFLEVIRAVLRNRHDLVIKPAEDPSFIERLFGTDDMHLLRECPCPVWLTKPGEISDYRCILAAVDFDPDRSDTEEQSLNQQILDLSTSLALSDFAELHVVHVWDTLGEMVVRTWSDNPVADSITYAEGERLRHQRGLDGLGAAMRERLGAKAYDYLSPRFHLHRGAASMLIPETAQRLGADLVVMGTVARAGIAGLFIGNTAEAILEQLRCSVLAVKPHDFLSPVELAE